MKLERYTKQIRVHEFGEKGQKTLASSRVIIIGAGGLGTNSANLLTRTGVGTITIVDDDLVDLTNLHRTAIFTENDIGKPKSATLVEKLKTINTSIHIEGIQAHVTRENIDQIVKNADIILDGSDNMDTRFLLNDYAVKNKIPWVYAGVAETVGMVMGIIPNETPCLRCMAQTIPTTAPPADFGTFSLIPVIAASMQCMEAIKILLGEKPAGFMLYDIWKQQFETLKVQKNPGCRCCEKHSFDFL